VRERREANLDVSGDGIGLDSLVGNSVLLMLEVVSFSPLRRGGERN